MSDGPEHGFIGLSPQTTQPTPKGKKSINETREREREEEKGKKSINKTRERESGREG